MEEMTRGKSRLIFAQGFGRSADLLALRTIEGSRTLLPLPGRPDFFSINATLYQLLDWRKGGPPNCSPATSYYVFKLLILNNFIFNPCPTASIAFPSVIPP